MSGSIKGMMEFRFFVGMIWISLAGAVLFGDYEPWRITVALAFAFTGYKIILP